MIAQIQISGSVPQATASEAGKAPKAAQGFAALMLGQRNPLAPQPPQKTDAPTVTTAPDAPAQGGGESAEKPNIEGPDALMALMDRTIAALHQSAEQVTPKRVLAGFAEALGAAVPDQLADLEAVAELADPELVTALHGKIDGALRLNAGVGQLSVASAAVPAVGRGGAQAPLPLGGLTETIAADPASTPPGAAPAANLASSIDASSGVAAAKAGKSAFAPTAATTPSTEAAPLTGVTPASPKVPGTPPAAFAVPEAGNAQVPMNAAGSVGTKTGDASKLPFAAASGAAFSDQTAAPAAQVEASPAAAKIPAPVLSPVAGSNSAATPTGLPPLSEFAEVAPTAPPGATAQAMPAQAPARGLPSGRLATAMETGKAHASMAVGAEGAQAADPRARAAEPLAPGAKIAEFAASLPSAGETLPREAAQLAAPAPAPTGEAPRLAPPNPVPAPPPNPAAPPEEQLRQHVAQQIRGFETSDNKLRFALSPYGMGDIEIEVVRLESGRMQIAMTTESAAVLNVLRQDREQLLEALQSRGLDADSADLDFQTFDDRGRGKGDERFAPMAEGLDGAAQPEDPAQNDVPAPRMSSGPGQLDILT